MATMERGPERTPQSATRWLGRLLAVLVLAALGTGAAAGWQWLAAPERFPLATVRLDGRLEKVAEEELRAAILPYLDRGMLGLDIERIRQAVAALPWVAEAAVRRQWPDTLVVEIRERVAVARWNAGVMDSAGQLFQPREETIPPDLPLLQGPPDSLPLVWARFQKLNALFGQAGLELRWLYVDERRAWTAELADGVIVKLGIDEMDLAVERFLRALPRIGAAAETRLVRVDLRYPNGFALAWASAAPQSPRE